MPWPTVVCMVRAGMRLYITCRPDPYPWERVMRHRFRQALALVVLGVGGLSCALNRSYDYGSTSVATGQECGILDRIIPGAGPMNTIGTLVVGGAGVTAGLRDENRDGFGLVSSVLGLFALWASQRHDSRLKMQACASDPDNPAIDSLQSHPFVLDSSGRISAGPIPAAP